MCIRDRYNRGLFIDDENWEKFENFIGKIKSPNNKRKFIIPKKIKMAVPYVEPSTQSVITPEVEVDLQNTSDDNYLKFMEVIDEAERLLMNATRTDIPYYNFVDELEAYYGNISVFKRDLCLIRDLIFTVKRFNSNFSTINMQCTKIICSVRSEILTDISRFIVTKELNKVTAGFAVPLMWNYSNTSSYMHPIIQILLKRIAVCEGCVNPDYKKVYERWLPENIHGIEPANYILNNSWCKPRDIVRLITTVQNSIYNSSKAFTQSVFDKMCIRDRPWPGLWACCLCDFLRLRALDRESVWRREGGSGDSPGRAGFSGGRGHGAGAGGRQLPADAQFAEIHFRAGRQKCCLHRGGLRPGRGQ